MPAPARVGILLFATLGVGWAAVISRPEGVLASEMWPVGLAAGALLLVRAGSALVVGAGVAVVGFASFALGGRPLDFAVCAGLAILAEALVINAILTDRGRRTASLVDDSDLSRFVLALASGGLVAGSLLGLAAWLVTDGPPLLTVVGTGAGHMSSALVLLPFLIRTDAHPAVAPPVERTANRVTLLVVTVAVFWSHDFPGLLFLVLPVLSWTALRCKLWEAQLQLVAVATVATVMTTFGFGPLAQQRGAYALPEYVLGIVLQAFLIACALVALPLSLAVGRQLAAYERSEREGNLMRRVIDSAHVAIIGSDAYGRINLFNPGAEQLLGYRPDEVLGRHTTMFHTEQEISDQARALGVPNEFDRVAMRLAHPEHAGALMRFVRKDGTERTHALTLSSLRDPRGTITGFVCSSADVTEEVAARQALLDALDAERRAVERLQEVDQAKDTFVSSVSHELRTPITSIVGYLEMLLEGEFGVLAAPQHTAVRRIDSNGKRLLSLVDDLLTLSRVGERQDTVMTRLDLRDAAGTAYDVVSPTWAQRGLDVRMSLPADEVPVQGDREQLERVVVNLLGNAAKFTPDGGVVTLAVARRADDALLTVSDSGIGIPAEEQQHLFTRFFRSSLAQRNAIQGSGLGLSISQEIVEEHGGSLSVESEPGVGTTFTVRLALADTPDGSGMEMAR